MSVACAAKVFRHFPLECDPSNKPLEWTGLQQLSAPPPQAPLPATQGSVRRIGSQGKHPWHKISGLKIDRSAIFSVPIDGRV
jgi:hypothetical protein